MADALISSLAHLADPQVLLLMVIAVVIGAVVGILPGLGSIVTMALLLPFVVAMDPFQAFTLLLGMYAITSITGDLTAILIGVPGTPTSAPLVIDGYTLAKQGQPLRAMGAAVASSGAGAWIGAAMLALAVPVVRPVVLSFASPEIFMLALLGLTMVGGLSGRSLLKGLAAGFLGLLISTMGPEAQTGVFRFSFGTRYLLDGVSVIPLTIGLFAIPELLDLNRDRGPAETSVSTDRGLRKGAQDSNDSIAMGFRDVLRTRWMVLRCSIIGGIIGAIPGLGGDVAAWAAYGHAQQSSAEPERFGRGSIEGVIGPGASNNSKEGGGLIPTIAFGVPGTAAMAVLLGAFVMVGVTPGPDMLGRHLDVTLFMIWVLVVANLLGCLISVAAMRPLARIVSLPGTLLVPFVLVFVIVGAGTASGQMGDLYTLIIFGLLAVVMGRARWPIVPLVLGYVLGAQTENNFWLSQRLYGLEAFTRPIVIGLALLAVLGTWYARRQFQGGADDPVEQLPRGAIAVSAAFGGVLTVLFAWAAVHSLGWSPTARGFPLLVSAVGGVLALAVTIKDVRRLWPSRSAVLAGPAGGGSAEDSAAPVAALFRRDAGMIAGLLAVVAGVWAVGIPLTLGVFTWVYLARVHGYGPVRSAVIGVATGLVLYVGLEAMLGSLVRLPGGAFLS